MFIYEVGIYISGVHRSGWSNTIVATPATTPSSIVYSYNLVIDVWTTFSVSSVYLYNPTTDIWTPNTSYPSVISGAGQSTLLDGTVLVTGGWSTSLLSSVYLYS